MNVSSQPLNANTCRQTYTSLLGFSAVYSVLQLFPMAKDEIREPKRQFQGVD